jgi:hypothetical protein
MTRNMILEGGTSPVLKTRVAYRVQKGGMYPGRCAMTKLYVAYILSRWYRTFLSTDTTTVLGLLHIICMEFGLLL